MKIIVKIIRATSTSFKEDPLRVYRVARFASELNFKVEQATIKMMNELKGELKSLSKERVFCEFRKASFFYRTSRKIYVRITWIANSSIL